MIKYFVGAVFLITGLSTAAAETHSRDVAARKASVVNGHVYYNQNQCTSGPIAQVKVKVAPKHGSVEIRRTTYNPPKGQRCYGKKFNAVVVVYTPKKGYHGKDTFKTRYSMPKYVQGSQMNYFTDTYKINVK
ncbi:hypothetical protein PsAD46_02352 [Pseudovibrio sp. Ad46]|uniref:hypothetical protein n=1 Tax=unclassified Pseudovibrio TaxID=2627060 RepID=UPI0007AEDE6E|nr:MULTISPECIES: hypothetical protein [unclassified Pseudovibrio]KZK88394.1 hypothetical protein PsAD46_02352 [Pseudovibrio sp. Ad46]